MTASSNETYLQTILTKYKLKDIYNVDGFGLFYQALPDKSSHYKGERCSDGKHSKVRLTGLAANDAMGEKKIFASFFHLPFFFFLFCFVFALILLLLSFFKCFLFIFLKLKLKIKESRMAEACQNDNLLNSYYSFRA